MSIQNQLVLLREVHNRLDRMMGSHFLCLMVRHAGMQLSLLHEAHVLETRIMTRISPHEHVGAYILHNAGPDADYPSDAECKRFRMQLLEDLINELETECQFPKSFSPE